MTISKGGTKKIDATQTKEVKGKELLTHKVALLRYKSEKPSVATVDENGTIKAVGTGWCRIYVQTVNGIWQTVEVTIKQMRRRHLFRMIYQGKRETRAKRLGSLFRKRPIGY